MSVMRCFTASFFAAVLASLVLGQSSAAQSRPRTNVAALDSLAEHFQQRLPGHRGPVYLNLLASVRQAQAALNENPNVQLMYIDERGRPVYYEIHNRNAAKTISTYDVWPGGVGGYSLTGSGTALGKLGIWDAGGVTTYHQELVGRVFQMDTPSGAHTHSTHVAGTMVASGYAGAARGMSFEANLAAYDWDGDEGEMASVAAVMNVSNHSYGTATGWLASGDWYWMGDPYISPTEDYHFGFYTSEAEDWDDIAFYAPYYAICKSAGNDRDDEGPGPGGGHWFWDNGIGDWVWSTDTRDPDGGDDGYDCLPPKSCAKNIITVGAVDDITDGYSSPIDVVMADFSSWGPTDDGRIKPDLVGNGIQLLSCVEDTNVYDWKSGTSMSAPSVSGSLNLLIRQYENTHGGATPTSAAMKALLIQTADEAGDNPGPDYSFGWGLMNTLSAADIIAQDAADPFLIHEGALENVVDESDTLYFYSDGTSPIRLTMAWTDPPGTPPMASLDPTTPMLVNDLDLRLEHLASSTGYMPYVLDPSDPAAPATAGDNTRDNVEQIHVDFPLAGGYMATITFKGTLWPGASNQWYSVVASQKLSVDCPDLTKPSVSVTAPNGGETLMEGQQYEITWTANDASGVDSVNVLYTTGTGFIFYRIANGEPNDSSYLWTVPATYSDKCRVRVVAFDPWGNYDRDDSDGTFEIVTRPDVPSMGRWGQLALSVLMIAMAIGFARKVLLRRAGP